VTNLELLHQKYCFHSLQYCLFSGDSSVYSLRFSLLPSSGSGTSFLVIIKHQKLHSLLTTSRTVMKLLSSPLLTQRWAIHQNVLWSCVRKPYIIYPCSLHYLQYECFSLYDSLHQNWCASQSFRNTVLLDSYSTQNSVYLNVLAKCKRMFIQKYLQESPELH